MSIFWDMSKDVTLIQKNNHPKLSFVALVATNLLKTLKYTVRFCLFVSIFLLYTHARMCVYVRMCVRVCVNKFDVTWVYARHHPPWPISLCVSRRVCVCYDARCVFACTCDRVCFLKFEILSLKILKIKHITEAWSYLHQHWWILDPRIEMRRCSLKGSLFTYWIFIIFWCSKANTGSTMRLKGDFEKA